MAEEGSAPSRFGSRIKEYLRDTPFFCKIIQLLLCVISLGLFVDPIKMLNTSIDRAFVYVALCSYIIINAVVIGCYLIGEKMTKNMAMIFATLGAILTLTAGIMLLHAWDTYVINFNKYDPNGISNPFEKQYLDQLISSGIFSIIASAIFVLDTYLTNKYECS